jgi:choline dehydrogenase
VRGQREDFDGWAALGNPGWSYEEVLPYFRRSEDQVRGADPWHGTGGELGVADIDAPHPIAEAFIAAAAQQGIPRNADFNGERQEGVGYFQATARKGLRCSAAVAFLRPARGRANLDVRTGAHVLRISFEGRRATGVVYRLSGVGDAGRLQALGIPVVSDLPAVGENLQDHLQSRLIYRTREKITVNDDLQSLPRKVAMVWKFAFGRRGPLGWLAGIAGGFARTSADLARPDVQFHLYPYSSDRVDPTLHPFSAFTLTVCKLRPLSRGRCHVASADPWAPPSIQPGYLGAVEDLATMIAAVKLGRSVAGAPALAALISAEYDPGPACASDADVEAFVRTKAFSVYHPVGTCAMAPDGVVDPALRVRGVEALRVIDASIMPAIVSGNTNAAAIMIGEKGADLVLADAR